MPIDVILVAGGVGKRFGGTMPKQFALLAGEPLLVHSARAFTGLPDLGRTIVVAARDHFEECGHLLAPLGLSIHFAESGPERQDSVRSGTMQLDPSADIVLVHDAARPLVTRQSIRACVEAARHHGAAIVATPVADTVKRCEGDRIVATVPRDDLWLAQTPQAFRAAELRQVHADAKRAGIAVTDDAALFEWAGRPVAIVAGDARNRKITTPEDLAWAEAVLAASGDRGTIPAPT